MSVYLGRGLAEASAVEEAEGLNRDVKCNSLCIKGLEEITWAILHRLFCINP